MNKFFKGSIGIFGGSTCIFSSVCPSICNAEKVPEDLKNIVVSFLEKSLNNEMFDKDKMLIFWALTEALKWKETSFDVIVSGLCILKYSLDVENQSKKDSKIVVGYKKTVEEFLATMKKHESSFKSGKYLDDVSQGLNSAVNKLLENDISSISYKSADYLFSEICKEKYGMWVLVLKTIKRIQEVSKKVYDAANMNGPENWTEEKKQNFLDMCNSKFLGSLKELRKIFGFSLNKDMQEAPTPGGPASNDVAQAEYEDAYPLKVEDIWPFLDNNTEIKNLVADLNELKSCLESSTLECKGESLQKFLNDFGLNCV